MVTVVMVLVSLVIAITMKYVSTTCASAPRVPLLMLPRDVMERVGRNSFYAECKDASSRSRLLTRGAEFDRVNQIAVHVIETAKAVAPECAGWNWRVAFIDSYDMNATQRPSAYVTFYAGLWRRLRLTDDELAVVVAHEVAHAIREHARERASLALLLRLLHALLPTRNAVAEWLFTKTLRIACELPFSREQELEADALALNILARNPYDASAVFNLWSKLQRACGTAQSKYFSTHPTYEERRSHSQRVLAVLSKQ